MKRHVRLWASFFAVTQLSAAPLLAQTPAKSSGTLQVTSASAEARAAFWAALDDANNFFPTRAAVHAKKAISLDPALGIARALYAGTAGLSPAQRSEELNRAVADAARASTGELVLAAAFRASVLSGNQSEEARVLANAAIALMPEDASVAYFRAVGVDEGQVVAALREVARKFPSFAPAFNTLAYEQWAAEDRSTALRTVQEYVRLAPNHPNSHDSFAELLQFSGRYAEALPHYQRAIALDPSYDQGYLGIAEVHFLMGNVEQAAAAFTLAADKMPTPTERLSALVGAAVMPVLLGKPKDALRELAALATTAEQQNLPALAATIHRQISLLEALFGDRKTIAGHLTKATELVPISANAVTPDAGPQLRYTALSYAVTGRLDLAKEAATRFAQVAAAGSAAQRDNSHEVKAAIAIAEKDLERARAELAQAGAAPFGRALLAEALRKSGKTADAQAIKNEVLATPPTAVPGIFDVLARAKLQKI